MNFRKGQLLYHLLTIVIAIGALTGASYAQSVTIAGVNPLSTPLPASTPAPSGLFYVKATATPPVSESVTKVVFYRNDVPYETVTSFPYNIDEDLLAQDTYTYHARAYFSNGTWADSPDFTLSVTTPVVFTMGDTISSPYRVTKGPSSFVDHTDDIEAALAYLEGEGGGTLFFPCERPFFPPGPPLQTLREGVAAYNIKSTINIPSNVTLQGESSEWWGRCRIYWLDVDLEDYGSAKDNCNSEEDGAPQDLRDRPMFRVLGGKTGVRFRDLAFFSRASGPLCGYIRPDFDNIAEEETAGIELNTGDPYCGEVGCPIDPGGDVTDVIFENVGIYDFTYGIRAVSEISTEHEISGVKVRGYRAQSNHRQLYIDAPYAYDWDVQNLNISSMAEHQGGVEIKNAGAPPSYTGTHGNLKFLQLNCAGDRDYPPAFCVQVTKHGGLFFRQLHHEGVDRAITVLEHSEGNEQPIVMESGIASGAFYDASMKLYLIGNGIIAPEKEHPFLDDVHMRFEDGGLLSTIVDCGNLDSDLTDIDGGSADIDDFKMLFSHTERYRGGFFAKKDTGNKMPHTFCPSASPNIAEVGGEFFDSGVLPNEPGLYTNVLDSTTCSRGCNPSTTLATLFANGGSVYIDGQYTLPSTVAIPSGMQIIGAPNAELTIGTSDPLFKIQVTTEATNPLATSAIVIRNLKLKTLNTSPNTIGIDMVNENIADVGVGRDMHFTGLTLEGFATGIAGRRHDSHPTKHPMIDGISMKDLTFINNKTAVSLTSSNASNWNVMNLRVQTNSSTAVGWSQTTGGHQGLQDVRCQGVSAAMKDCIFFQYSGAFYLNGLRQPQNVTNAVTVGENVVLNEGTPYAGRHFSNVVIRNSDLTSGAMNILGKAFITSMNNKYNTFSVGSTAQGGKESRVTYCGETYAGTAYPGLDDLHDNLWVGMQTPTRIQCGTRPIPYDNAVRWTEDYSHNDVGTPLVGNFFDELREDFVVYKPDTNSKFLIQQPDGDGRHDIYFGVTGDLPVIGRFFAGSRAQIAIFRPSTGAWWVYDPNNGSNNTTWPWGLSGDVPFVGNFHDESAHVSENKDEIGVYRPSTQTFYIKNPRTTATDTGSIFATTADNDSIIQVGDFLGQHYDQIAQYKGGNWKIVDPRNSSTIYTATIPGLTWAAEDVPVAGRYLPQVPGKDPCIQVGIWRPSEQKFYIADVNDPETNCGARTANMVWGLNNGAYPDDIPLTINTADGLLRRPTAYRRTKGIVPTSIADGQWWVHDPF